MPEVSKENVVGRWKAIDRRHYEQAMALQGEARERYVVSLVEAWPDGRIAREGWLAMGEVGDFERLTKEQVGQVVEVFRAMFEDKKAVKRG